MRGPVTRNAVSVCAEWGQLWMLTDEELQAAVDAAGWTRVEERRNGGFRVTLLESPLGTVPA